MERKMAKRILVADDDQAAVTTLSEILKSAGYEVSLAFNGEECLKKVMLDSPDLLLLDIMMPRMDGFHFLTAIKELQASKDNVSIVPVVVITGKDIDPSRTLKNVNLMVHKNIKGYFTKPYDLTDLLAKIKEVLGE
jgi:two-component system alkaline phosphatase synthesis response regulator PhoP/two-component system response regulator VicR